MTTKAAVKHKVLKLNEGFYAIRYVAERPDSPIALLRSLAIDKQAKVDAIGAKRDDAVLLSQASPLVILHVEGGQANVTISLLIADAFQPKGVTFDVERISERLPKKTASSSSLIYLSGHIAWRGDVKSPPGIMLGAEKGTNRIEGFTVNWLKKPKNIDITYGCKFGQMEETSTALGGGFVGSRKQSAPITSLWMALEGQTKNEYELDYKAAFSAAGIVSARQGEVVSGSDQDDYVVGIWAVVTEKSVSNNDGSLKISKKVREFKTFRSS